jgi:putative transposase
MSSDLSQLDLLVIQRSTACILAMTERLLRNLARRLEQQAPGVAATILEGLDEMLTVNRLNMMGTVRRVCRNVKRWRNAAMALRWTAAGMMEAAKGFRRLKAYRLLPILRAALVAHAAEHAATKEIEPQTNAA